jgi:predicted permease
MMMIGLGLAGRTLAETDVRLLGFTTVAKFVVWPLTMVCILAIDASVTRFYGHDVWPVMLLLSMVPLAANTVAFSNLVNVHPGKAAVAVLTSTLVALVAIPVLFTSLLALFQMG